MAFLYVTEFARSGLDLMGRPSQVIAEQLPLAEQKIAIAVGSTGSAAFNAKTRLVRLHADVACSILFGSGSPAAAVTNARMPANSTEYFMIDGPGHAVAPLSVANIAN